LLLLLGMITPRTRWPAAGSQVLRPFADQGLGDAVIQRRILTRLQLDTAFWAAMATGGLLTALGLILAGPIAQLVREPRLEPILQALSLIFVLVALSSIQMGLLRREMDFRSLAVRKLVAIAVGGAVGIVMAFQNYGAWSLVGQQLTSAAVDAEWATPRRIWHGTRGTGRVSAPMQSHRNDTARWNGLRAQRRDRYRARPLHCDDDACRGLPRCAHRARAVRRSSAVHDRSGAGSRRGARSAPPDSKDLP